MKMVPRRLLAAASGLARRGAAAPATAAAAPWMARANSGPPASVVPMRDFDVSPLHVAGVRGAKTTIEEYDPQGFTINNVRVRGSVLAFPHHSLLFRPGFDDIDDVSIASLAAVSLAEPAVEILIVGCGDSIKARVDPALAEHFRRQGTVVELMNTVNACATFNILNAEDRSVAAVLLCPPADVEEIEA